MPKGKKDKFSRGKKPGSGRSAVPEDLISEGDDRESLGEAESVTSSVSEAASQVETDEGTQEPIETEELEEKLKEAVDGLYEKSVQRRTASLQFLTKSFQSRLVTDFLVERSETLTDAIERCLRKGKGPEQGAAAQLATSAMLQLGGDGSSYLFKALHPVMLTLLADGSVQAAARGKIASALGLLTFLCGENVDEFADTMKTLESVFSTAYLKGNGTPPSFTPDMFTLVGASLASWSLLLSLLSPQQTRSYVSTHMSRLPGLLDSPDLEIRIAAGECIALLYEIMREQDEMFEMECHDDLCDKLRLLATDSQKFRAKKDRKQQRSSFREILKTVEEGENPSEAIKFGREILGLGSWSRKLQYDSVCDLLGPGTNLHLSLNELLREIFALGPVIAAIGTPSSKLSKFDRHLCNVAAFKARTIARNKTRDKRSYDVEDF